MPTIYTYEIPVVEVLAVEPSSGPVAGGTAVVITGRGFVPGVAVLFGGAAATVTDDTAPDRIAVLTPAHAAGDVDVVVTNPDTTTTTLEDGYTYEAAPPPDRLKFWDTGGASGSVARMRTENAAPRITFELGGAGSFSFSTTIEPAGESTVEYRVGGQLLFLGTIVRKLARVDGEDRLEVWDCAAADLSHRLSRRLARGEWVATSATAILSDLMGQFGAGFTAVIEPGLPPTTVKLDGSSDLWSALGAVCQAVGAKLFLDGTTLHVFTVDSLFDPPAPVTEGNPDLQWTDNGQPLTLEWDYTGIVNRVRVRGAEGLEVVVEDAASIAQFGTTEFAIDDNTLASTEELVAAGRAKLKSSAFPIPVAHYVTRDLKTAIGKTVSITIARPAIAGTFVIQTVAIDQFDAVAAGVNPRFTVTAKPATAPMRRDQGIAVLLEKVVDLAAAENKSPRLTGAIESDPGGPTKIPDGSITAGKLAGCIGSDLLEATGAAPGPYGTAGKMARFTIDAAGRVTAAETDPVAVAKVDGSQPFEADQSMGGNALEDLADPVDPQDATTKAYVDAAVAAVAGGGGDIKSDGSVAFAADQSMGGHKITNLQDPANPQDAATRAYVLANAGAGGGAVKQVVHSQTGAVATGSTVIPFDDTIPQQTEGTQFLSATITPTDAANVLDILVQVWATVTATPWIIVALFRDAGADAVAVVATFNNLSTAGASIPLRVSLPAGSTAGTTFKVRIGPSGAATVTLNGQSGGRIFGGVAVSGIQITERTP